MALLDGDGWLGPVGTDLYYETSSSGKIDSGCYFDRLNE